MGHFFGVSVIFLFGLNWLLRFDNRHNRFRIKITFLGLPSLLVCSLSLIRVSTLLATRRSQRVVGVSGMSLNYFDIFDLAVSLRKGSKVKITVVGEAIYDGYVVSVNEKEIEIDQIVTKGERDEDLGSITGQLKFQLEQIDKMKCLDSEFSSINAQREAIGKVMKPHVKPAHLLQQTIPTDQSMVDSAIATLNACPMPDCHHLVLDSVDSNDFSEAIRILNNENVVSLGYQGVRVSRTGQLCWLSMGTADSTRIFLFDILKMGAEAFNNGLKAFLENGKVMKVIHDCRYLSDCLGNKYGVMMNNIFDTQVSRIVLFKNCHNGDFPRYVDSLSQTLSELIPQVKIPQLMIRCYAAEEDEKIWKERPLPQAYVKYLVLQVFFLPQLRMVVMERLMAEHACCVNLYLDLVRTADPKTAAELLDHSNNLPEEFIQRRKEAEEKVEQRNQRQNRSSDGNTKTGRSADTDVRYSRDTWHKLDNGDKGAPAKVEKPESPKGPEPIELGFSAFTRPITPPLSPVGNGYQSGSSSEESAYVGSGGSTVSPEKKRGRIGLGRGGGIGSRMGKSKFVLVALESVITGHRRFAIRDRLGEKIESLFRDPMLNRTVLYKEVKKVKGKDSVPAPPVDPVL